MTAKGKGFLRMPKFRTACPACRAAREVSEAAWAVYMRATRAEFDETLLAYKVAANAERTHWNVCQGLRRFGGPYQLFAV